MGAEASKCVKFESGLRPEIKQLIGHQEIHQFLVLVNKCMIFDKDTKAISTRYKIINDRKGKGQDRGKPYVSPTYKGKKKVAGENEKSGGGLRWYGTLYC